MAGSRASRTRDETDEQLRIRAELAKEIRTIEFAVVDSISPDFITNETDLGSGLYQNEDKTEQSEEQ